ncbi:MAG: PPC domain-containing protein [Myxococcota bacterium]|nr:PPC domain-containing protein [Myxococcota bacterium]
MIRYSTLMVATIALCVSACVEDREPAMRDQAASTQTDAAGASTQGSQGGGAMGDAVDAPSSGGGQAGASAGLQDGGEEMAGTQSATDGTDDDSAERVDSCGNEDDLAPNFDLATAADIEFGFARDDLFRCPDTTDWYRIPALAGRQMRIVLRPDPANAPFQLALLRENGSQLESGRRQNESIAITYVPAMDETLYLRVGARGGTVGYYALSVTGQCRLDQDCDAGQVCDRIQGVCERLNGGMCGRDASEPNNTDAEATIIQAPTTDLTAVICAADRDWYGFEASDGDSYEMIINFPSGEDLDVFVINAETGAVIDQATSDRRTNPERLAFSYLPAGQYRVGITLFLDEDTRDHDVEYSIDFTGRSGACRADRDCDAAGLPRCVEGVCTAPEANAGLGERCATSSDCSAEADLCYTGGEGGHDNFCTVRCRDNSGCMALGAGAQCARISRRDAVCFPGCESDNDCSAFRRCDGGECVVRGQCRVDEDCDEGTVCRSIRTGERYCGVPTPVPACGADPDVDPNNNRDDASELQLGQTLEGRQICNDDDDWYVVTVPDDNGGDTFVVTAQFRQGVDIDVYLYDAAGNVMGEATSPDQVEEEAEMAYVSPGLYYVRVDQFSSDRLVDTQYTISARVNEFDEGCTVAGNECARTRPLRSLCDEDSGGCLALEGDGAIALGSLCDSADDCAPREDGDTICWPPRFLEDQQNIEDVRWPGSNICTHWCRRDNDCRDVPETSCIVLSRRGDGVCLPARDRGADGEPGVMPSPDGSNNDGD